MIRFERLAGALGADVHGIDLRQPLTTDTANAIREGLVEHLVLFFRNQELLTTEQHLALVRNFGEPEPRRFGRPGVEAPPYVVVLDHLGDPSARQAAPFHADNTFLAEPPLGAILQAHIVPQSGGDTCFSSMYAAYEALSARMQAYLDGLEAYHSYAQMVARLGKGRTPLMDPADHPPIKHPVVARHPVTGRKLLFVNYNWTTHIDGLPPDENAAVLKFLYEHIRSPEFQVRCRWNRGDITFWDNRATQHCAVQDYNERRLIHRVSILPRAQAERPLEKLEGSLA